LHVLIEPAILITHKIGVSWVEQWDDAVFIKALLEYIAIVVYSMPPPCLLHADEIAMCLSSLHVTTCMMCAEMC